MNLIIIDLKLIEQIPNISLNRLEFINLDYIDIEESIKSGYIDFICLFNNKKYISIKIIYSKKIYMRS